MAIAGRPVGQNQLKAVQSVRPKAALLGRPEVVAVGQEFGE